MPLMGMLRRAVNSGDGRQGTERRGSAGIAAGNGTDGGGWNRVKALI